MESEMNSLDCRLRRGKIVYCRSNGGDVEEKLATGRERWCEGGRGGFHKQYGKQEI